MAAVVLGSSGMLGSALCDIFRERGIRVFPVTRVQLDVSHRGTLLKLEEFVQQCKKDYTLVTIINAIGIIKPQTSSAGIETTLIVNGIFPRLMADVCEKHNVHFVHITDCVFSGNAKGYAVDSPSDMTDDYGWSKAVGEPRNCTLVRTSIIGEELHNSRSLVEWLRTKKGKTIDGFTNHFWNGVTCRELGRFLVPMVMCSTYSHKKITLHSKQTVTKAELCQMISDAFRWDITVRPVEHVETINRTLWGPHTVARSLRDQVEEMAHPRAPVYNVVTVTGIRPDFIRMSQVFKNLDAHPCIQHTMIHTGQHFEQNLSEVFFRELGIRPPDITLKTGAPGRDHVGQHAELSKQLVSVLRDMKVDMVVFLGDSNSVLVAPVLKKCGYKIAHIEAGMRSFDERMLEETNRKMCDHSSDLLLVYHANYKDNLLNEGISGDRIRVVGNTIVEVVLPFVSLDRRSLDYILVDIHRPENFNDPERMVAIVKWLKQLRAAAHIPIKWIRFRDEVKDDFEYVEKMGYREYLRAVHHARCVVSDSGTAQEECVLVGTPVLVPRDFTERPESVQAEASRMVNVMCPDVEDDIRYMFFEGRWANKKWLGNGNTSSLIVHHIMEKLLTENDMREESEDSKKERGQLALDVAPDVQDDQGNTDTE